jgi:hypothetical protein
LITGSTASVGSTPLGDHDLDAPGAVVPEWFKEAERKPPPYTKRKNPFPRATFFDEA